MLGVVENMSGLRQPMSSFQFFGPGGEDITAAVLAAAGAVAGAGGSGDGSGIWAETSVFHASGGGAQAMAADMQVGGDTVGLGGLAGWLLLLCCGQPPPRTGQAGC